MESWRVCQRQSLRLPLPAQSVAGPVFEASESWNLIPEDDAMVLVAREGYQQHHSLLSIPLNDAYLDQRFERTSCKTVTYQ
jgi:hypothetical protein